MKEGSKFGSVQSIFWNIFIQIKKNINLKVKQFLTLGVDKVI